MEDFLEDNTSGKSLVNLYEATLKGEIHKYFDVDDYVEIIEYYITHLHEDKAQEVLSTALEQHSNALSLKYKQAELWVLQGKLNKSLGLIKELEQLSNDVDLQLLRGTIYTSMGRLNDANKAFLQAIEMEGEDKESLFFRIGMAFQHVLEFHFALEYHYKLYEREPEDLENLFEIAYCYEQLNLLDKSIVFYNKYLDLAPYSHKVWYNIGIIYNQLQKYEQAVDAYDYALAIRPKHSKAYFNKGNALFYLKRYKEALKCYFMYLDYEDNHSYTHTYIGECYEKEGAYESAILHYEKALELDESLSDAWFGLGMVEKLRGDVYKAIQYMEKAAKVDNTYAECYVELGALYAVIEEDILAINAYKYAIISEPDVFQYHLELAKFYHSKGEIAEALSTLIAVKNDFNQEAELFYYLSLFSFLMGEREAAKNHLNKARQIDNGQFDMLLNYCKRNESLITKGQIDELLKLD